MTKEIELTQGKVALVDDEDYEELSQYKWRAFWNGYHWYAVRGAWHDGKGDTIYMHRQILNAPPDKQVDHINRRGVDNRRENLRLCTNSQNQANGKGKEGSSRYKGVRWRKQRRVWQANITKNGNFHHLGHFDDEDEAAKAYNKAARELFGKFARLNEIES